MTSTPIAAFQEHPAFRGLSQDSLAKINQSSKTLRFRIGQTITDGSTVPANVVMIRMTREELYKRFFSVDTYANYVKRDGGGHSKPQLHSTHKANTNVLDEASLFESLCRLIDMFAYMTVEYKPALASIFSDYVASYSHWAYMDMDKLIGRLDLKFPPSLLREYDIITTSNAYNYRWYLR